LNASILLVSKRSRQTHHLLRQALRADGYGLNVVGDIETALTEARQNPPIALILESELTGQDDLALCQWLRTDPATIAVQMLVTTRTSQQRLAALEAGADELLTYPLDWVEVRTRLRSLRVEQSRLPSLEDFLHHTPDLALGANPVDILGSADLLAHDLKSPLGIIVSSAEMLRDLAEERLPPDQVALDRQSMMLENILQAARRETFLINDMLDLAKLEIDAYPIRQEPVDLELVAHTTVQANAAAIERKNVHLTVNASPDLPAASGDRELIGRVFNVLLDTALKFASGGDTVVWTLADSGGRSPPRCRSRPSPAPGVCRAHLRAECPVGSPPAGQPDQRGDGPALCARALRRMGGNLTASSILCDNSTTFLLRLPTCTLTQRHRQ
jgi:signal transduction histidine kinase